MMTRTKLRGRMSTGGPAQRVTLAPARHVTLEKVPPANVSTNVRRIEPADPNNTHVSTHHVIKD